MPKHEVDTGLLFSECYESSNVSYATQLHCLCAPAVDIKGCRIYFNAQL
jgi:hypothetical protein